MYLSIVDDGISCHLRWRYCYDHVRMRYACTAYICLLHSLLCKNHEWLLKCVLESGSDGPDGRDAVTQALTNHVIAEGAGWLASNSERERAVPEK